LKLSILTGLATFTGSPTGIPESEYNRTIPRAVPIANRVPSLLNARADISSLDINGAPMASPLLRLKR
jgi:hypothetical protein